MNRKLVAGLALTAVIAASGSSLSFAAGDKEKCYGIAKIGQNDCANLAGTHSCAGQSTVDKDIGEWKLVAKGSCKTLGGYSKKEAKKIFKS